MPVADQLLTICTSAITTSEDVLAEWTLLRNQVIQGYLPSTNGNKLSGNPCSRETIQDVFQEDPQITKARKIATTALGKDRALGGPRPHLIDITLGHFQKARVCNTGAGRYVYKHLTVLPTSPANQKVIMKGFHILNQWLGVPLALNQIRVVISRRNGPVAGW